MVRAFKGSVTVEASLVMSITLFVMAGLLQGVFDMHARTAEAFILAEGLEKHVFFEEQAEQERGRSREDIGEEQTKKLHSVFGCGKAGLSLSGDGLLRVEGSVTDTIKTEMSVRRYDPEGVLRRFRAIQDIAEGQPENEGILKDSLEVAQSRDGLPRSKIEGRNEGILKNSLEVAGSRDGLPRSKIEGRKGI